MSIFTILHAEITSKNNARLAAGLKKFPQADTNKDGILTLSEARKFKNKNKKNTKITTYKMKPTFTEVQYGKYPRNVLDFWKAESDVPTPVVIYIHGGGFIGGSKEKIDSNTIKTCLKQGISVASINYRFLYDAPIQDILRDAARAVQFIRNKANEWNVNKDKIGCYGGSAGAGTSIWLAFHDDLADPQSKDPVLRESTRLQVAGFMNGQFTYDLTRWPELFDKNACEKYMRKDNFGFYHLKSVKELKSPEVKKILADVDMHGLISKDDPPVYLQNKMPSSAKPKNRNSLNHHPNHAKAIKEKCESLGIEIQANIPSLKIKPANNESLIEFLIRKLK